jgi:hypothetical protein
MTRLLRRTGMRLSDAKSATDAILDFVPTVIDLPPHVDKGVFISKAKALGAVVKE